MSRNFWIRMPAELQEKVFALLPVSSILRCRAVCKQWRITLLSKSFLQHWSRIAAPVPWFLMFRDHKFRAYSPSLGTWHDIPVSSKFSQLDMDLTSVVASAGGLIFLSSQKKNSPPLLLVCNPLTMSCRILPKMNRVSLIYIMGMLADPSSTSYRILVSGISHSSSKELITEIYDSSLGYWQHHASSNLDIFHDFSGMRAVWCNGFFYCLSVPPYKLLAYDMKQKRWIRFGTQSPLPNLCSASLFVCQERLMMAGKVMQGASLKQVKIWELNTSDSSWQELTNITSSSNTVLNLFCKCLMYFMALQRSKGLDSVCFNSWCRWRTLMYDISLKSWHWLPEHCGRFKDMLSGLTYEPTFSARP